MTTHCERVTMPLLSGTERQPSRPFSVSWERAVIDMLGYTSKGKPGLSKRCTATICLSRPTWGPAIPTPSTVLSDTVFTIRPANVRWAGLDMSAVVSGAQICRRRVLSDSSSIVYTFMSGESVSLIISSSSAAKDD